MSKRNATVQPLLAAAVLALGFGVVWGLIVGLCVVIPKESSSASRVREGIVVRSDGTPVIRSRPADDYWDVTDRTLDGKLVPHPRLDRQLQGALLWGPPQERGPFLRLGWDQRIMSFQDSRPPTFWYFVHTGELKGAGYFVGYDSRSKLLVGYIGEKGYRASQPPREEWFPVDSYGMGPRKAFANAGASAYCYQPSGYFGDAGSDRFPGWLVYLLSEDRLLEINLRDRSVRVVTESQGLLSAGLVEQAVPPAALEDPKTLLRVPEFLAVRESDRVLILDPDGTRQRSYTIPAEIRAAQISFYELSNSTALMHSTRRSTEGISTHTFLWIDEQGQILRREEVATGEASFLQSPSFVSCMLAVAVPAPAIVTPVVILGFTEEYVTAGEAADYPSAVGMALSDTWPILLLINLLGVALAWVCYRRQKTYDQPTSWVWVGFVFLFGVPALLGYLFHRRWAVREICPACKAIAPRDRESCVACGEEFPQPARRGTEVLV